MSERETGSGDYEATFDFNPKSRSECVSFIARFHDALAPLKEKWIKKNAYYHGEVKKELKFLINPGASVLEVGCATGSLLASLEPSFGVGVDVSGEMIKVAKELHGSKKNLSFEHVSIEDYDSKGRTFDYIVISDVLSFVYDIGEVFRKLKPLCHCRTRIVINAYSNLWTPIVKAAVALGLKAKQPILNWVSGTDVRNLLEVNGFEVIYSRPRILCPIGLPLIGTLCNKFLATIFPINELCATNFIVARLPMAPLKAPVKVSVICPCRNESGNISDIVARLPKIGDETELIFVEGNSKDDTYDRCVAIAAAQPEKNIKVYRQTGKGKGDAMRLGYDKATGDILMILDADMTVAPEDLPKFYEPIVSGTAEFVNGSRLVYAMEGNAMRFLNLCANKFFGLAFTYLMEQSVKDTLCGTKVLLRDDYLKIAAARSYFGDFDPFGDFDLLFGASKLALKIRDMPIRYRNRTFGETQISRFRHGAMLFHMCFYALFKLRCR